MTDKIIEELTIEFLKESYPIIRIRFPNKLYGEILPHGGLKTKGNFKRIIRINSNVMFKMSDTNDKNRAMYTLSDIVCRVFNISQDESIPMIKKHLHIK